MRDDEPNDLPLDELQRAWRSLQPTLPPEELERADPQTRATVEWVRAAWSSLAVPEPRVPVLRRSRPVLRPALHLAAGLAAAAAVLVSLWLAGNEPPVQRSEDVARSKGEETITPSGSEGPQLAALSSHHIELRSGPVRLILLKDQRPQ